jgi:2'-5' RNA ligase
VVASLQEEVIKKVAGWWAIDPEGGKGQIDWDNSGTPGGLANELPGNAEDSKRYNGDGPADLMDAAMADIDLAYRQAWGRPAFPEELKAVFDFCFGPMREDGVDSSVWPENKWIDEAAAIAGVSQDVIVNMSERDLADTERMYREMRNSGISEGLKSGPVGPGMPGPTSESIEEWQAHVNATLHFERERAQRVLGKAARRLVARHLQAKHEWQTGDGSGVWTGFRIPEPYADQFPDLGDEDNSPPHITFLYIGEVDPERSEELAGIISDVFSTARLVRAQHLGLDYFEQPDREGRVAINRVRFSHDLAGYRDQLRSRLEDAGFEVADSFPVYQPHTTLEYLDEADATYRDQVPKGSWSVGALEVWGLPQVYVVPLGAEG